MSRTLLRKSISRAERRIPGPRCSIAVIVCVAIVSVASATGAGAAPGSTGERRIPTVTGPVTGGKGISDVGTKLYEKSSQEALALAKGPSTEPTLSYESLGYEREEYFIEGEAVSYKPVGQLSTDGKWKVDVDQTAPYKTRIVVLKPSDPADFNGTVYVEWYNVSGGFDAPVTFIMTHNQMLREGAAWVGVTAQSVGVKGGIPTAQSNEVDVPQGGLVGEDPERYGTLTHPGDAFSYDIFSQGGVAVRGDGTGPKPFEGYDVKRVIALGESQSASRMTTYVNAVAPIAGVYDGYFIQSRQTAGSPFGAEVLGTRDPSIPLGTQTRKDIDVPVLTFETEYDVDHFAYADARQPDSKHFRAWEVAGTSHADAYTGGQGPPAITDLGQGEAEATLLDPAKTSGGRCGATPANAGGQHVAAIAALAQLERWVRTGKPPPKYPRLKTSGTGDAIEVARDEHGNALGGIRSPLVDAPIATNDGFENAGFVAQSADAAACQPFGNTKPFDAAALAALYPNGSTQWVKAFDKAADRAVKDGVWLEPEAKNFKAAARKITFG